MHWSFWTILANTVAKNYTLVVTGPKLIKHTLRGAIRPAHDLLNEQGDVPRLLSAIVTRC